MFFGISENSTRLPARSQTGPSAQSNLFAASSSMVASSSMSRSSAGSRRSIRPSVATSAERAITPHRIEMQNSESMSRRFIGDSLLGASGRNQNAEARATLAHLAALLQLIDISLEVRREHRQASQPHIKVGTIGAFLLRENPLVER